MVLRTRWMILAGFIPALLASCGGRAPEPIQVTPEHQVFYSDDSQWPEEAAVVIRDAEEWRLWWERLTGSTENRPPVDFDSSMLLLFNAGKRFPGDRIQIQELLSGEAGTVVRYRIEESGIQESEVYPVQVVRVRRRPGPVRFQRVTF